MTSLEWELVINDKVCNGTDQILNRNPLTVNCANANITQCLTLGRHLHLKTSPSECARACKGISFAFMFGSNETDNSKCNEQGCICSCGQNIDDNDQCDQPNPQGFQTYQFVQSDIGRNWYD